MTLRTPEAAGAFGALDGDALAIDGNALSSLELRALSTTTNHLIRRGHQCLNLIWPVTQTTIEGRAMYANEFTASVGSWELVHPPVTVPKKPGLTTGTVYVVALIPSGADVEFTVQTGASQRLQDQAVTCAGTGAFERYTLPVEFVSGSTDSVAVYARAGARGAPMDESTYGAPNSWTMDWANGDRLTSRHGLIKASPTAANWNTATPTIAEDGHEVRFFDGGSGALLHAGRITHVDSSQSLIFDAMSAATRDEIWQKAQLSTTPPTVEITEIPTVAVAQILGVLNDRPLV